jgi:hypothetical protein
LLKNILNNLSKHSRGILFVATGKKYHQECIRSIKALNGICDQIPVAVFTDAPEAFDSLACYNISIKKLDEPSFGFSDKIYGLLQSPFKQTLFLDSDTLVLRNPIGIFDLLERFGIAIAAETYNPHPISSVPDSFPEFNTGVVALNTSMPDVSEFLNNWLTVFIRDLTRADRPKHDQPSFREALYHSKLNVCTLSSEWNFHVAHPALLNAGAQIKILHTRLADNQLCQQILSKTKDSRVFLPTVSCLHPNRLGSPSKELDFWLRVMAMPFRIWSNFRKK